MDIGAWLRELGLEQYEPAFRDNDIDAAVLPELTAEDLKDLGVASVGHRRRLLAAIVALRSAPSLTSQPVAEPAEAASEPAKGSRTNDTAAHEPERRQLTVMFIDLVGSTAMADRRDPEELRSVIRAYQEAVAGEIGRFDGHLAKYMGDGVLAYFGYPRAHEDDAERAVRAGLAIGEAVGRLAAPDGAPLVVRLGIATGLVVVGELIGEGAAREEAIIGDTPNLAARLQALAAPGAIVIAPTTRRLLGGLFELRDLGSHRFKGIAAPIRAWQVLGAGAAESRFEALRAADPLTPLIGREHEIGLLLDRWERAKEGEGQVVLLCGEPGIGKSRIIKALREQLAGEPHRPLSHYCSPHHQDTAFYPVIGLLERAAGIAPDDSPPRRLDKLETLLALSTKAPMEIAPLLAALLSIPTGDRYPPLTMSPQRRKELTLTALVDQLAGLAVQQPALPVYEDVHWSDPSTLELLDLVVDRTQTLSALTIITSRPEFASRWTSHAHVTPLALGRLSRRQTAAMVGQVTGGKTLPPEVLGQILAKTDGIPLFVEELTKTVLEGDLLRDEGKRYTLAGALTPLAVPATLQDSLMARLDRLAPVREVAQLGAAIGREFSYGLLAEVSPLRPTELEDALARLVKAGLLFRRGAPPEAAYRFKHALVQDAAYRSLLHSRRQQLHARIATALEERFPNTAKAEPELLADHYTEAGLVENAIAYRLKAGELAIRRCATAEAISQLAAGLELVKALPDGADRLGRELDLQVALGGALLAAKGFAAPETGRAHARALALCRQLGDSPQLFRVLYGQYVFYQVHAEFRASLRVAEELLRLAEEQNDTAPLLIGHRAVGNASVSLGDFASARTHLEQALALYDPARHESLAHLYTFDPRVAILSYLAWTLFALGYPDQAQVRGGELMTVAQETSHLSSTAFALFFGGVFHQFSRHDHQARDEAEAVIELAGEQGFAFWLAGGMVLGRWALAKAGEADAGIAEMRRGAISYLGTGARYLVPYFRALLADACGVARYPGPARLSLLDKAIARARGTGEGWFEAELHRLKGEVLACSCPDRDRAEAEACFRRAIAIARERHARLWELRAAVSLARLWADAGERQRAYELIAPVYGWFTEGFDTPDLREAQELLGTCGGAVASRSSIKSRHSFK